MTPRTLEQVAVDGGGLVADVDAVTRRLLLRETLADAVGLPKLFTDRPKPPPPPLAEP